MPLELRSLTLLRTWVVKGVFARELVVAEIRIQGAIGPKNEVRKAPKNRLR